MGYSGGTMRRRDFMKLAAAMPFLGKIDSVVNGVRLVYPMEKGSMQFLNLVANKLFGHAFSWLLGQSIQGIF